MTIRGFRAGHAAGGDWESIADSCIEQLGPCGDATLGFVYATDLLADSLEPILARLTGATGIADWVGTIGFGVCVGGKEYFNTPAMAVLAGAVPPDSYRILPTVARPGEHLPGDLGAWAEERRPVLGIVHGDPRNRYLPAIIDSLCDDTECFLVGGLTASRGAFSQVAGGDIVDGGLSGVLLAREVGVATGLSQGCAPIGAVHDVTRAEDNVLYELNGRPALDVFKEDIGEVLARNLERVGGYIHAALPIPGSDTADYLVRNVMGIDPGNGWLSIGERLQEGDKILFVRRDGPSAFTDLERMLGEVTGRAGEGGKAGLYFSCVARGPNMFASEDQEMTAVAEAVGAGVPVVGFYANGEISNNRLYGYTGVLTLIL
ncbi:MAG: FIST C-terminal domain-containing protein [Defluviicoccus sp.]|nr:FIST C-terminal domain-containing protein [Defluviicoccus sp.]MDE0384237.1 FIST C-terminal domain-containing protein [Defluviicoccus sp.]